MEDEFIWSGTDFPYACLVDKKRTLTFKKAIDETVKPGDTVIDIGSGTGILAFFAATAGAKKVYAVEVDHLLADSLRQSIKLNNMEDTIEVVEQDAMKADLPKAVDVVVAELIETGLLDEMQVKVMNELHAKGVIGSNTKIIPRAYETFVRLMEIDNIFYGYKIAAPIHDWPYYAHTQNGWHELKKQHITDSQSLGHFDFEKGEIIPNVDETLEFDIRTGQTVNALELSGIAHLTSNIEVNDEHTFNGNKILSIEPIVDPQTIKLRIRYEMSRGLGDFKIEVI